MTRYRDVLSCQGLALHVEDMGAGAHRLVTDDGVVPMTYGTARAFVSTNGALGKVKPLEEPQPVATTDLSPLLDRWRRAGTLLVERWSDGVWRVSVAIGTKSIGVVHNTAGYESASLRVELDLRTVRAHVQRLATIDVSS